MSEVALQRPTITVEYQGELRICDELVSANDICDAEARVGHMLANTYMQLGGEVIAITTMQGSVPVSEGVKCSMQEYRPELSIISDYIGVHSYDGAKSTGDLDKRCDFKADVNDKDVLLFEDVIEGGGTMDWLLSHIAKQSPRSLRVVSLFLKPGPYMGVEQVQLLRPDSTSLVVPIMALFTVGQEFIIGHGLDLEQRYRNLRSVYAMRDAA